MNHVHPDIHYVYSVDKFSNYTPLNVQLYFCTILAIMVAYISGEMIYGI